MSYPNLALLAVLIGIGPAGASAEDRLPLHVAYVGRAGDEARRDAFVAFLSKTFDGCSVVDREEASSDRLRGVDVVLLDWSWQEPRADRYDSPLWSLEDWSIPTVLLGSAGLLIAGPWRVIGGAG